MSIYNAEESYQESQFRWQLLLLAIIINLALLIVLFLLTTDNDFLHFPMREESAPVVFQDMPEQMDQFPQPPPPQVDSNEVAALKPGASNFGMPEEFKEDEMVAKLTHDEQPAEITPLIEEKINEEMASDTIKQPEQKPSAQPIDSPHELYELLEPTTTPDTKKQDEKKLITPEAFVEKKVQKPESQPRPQPEKIRAPLKKELTFNDIAKGFLSSLDEGGNDLIERKGNENIRPDFEEMRYLSYVHKIIWYMQNEWQRDTSIGQCAPPAMVITGISVTIDKDGNLQHASVTQSCGNHQLDEAVIRGIRAASPYPPLPSYLKKDQLKIDFGVKHISTPHNRLRF